MNAFHWSGRDAPYLDTPSVTQCGHVTMGRYGGASGSGASKNEDAALVWAAPDKNWTVAALLDAHGSSESAELVLGELMNLGSDIEQIMDGEGNKDRGHEAELAGTHAPLWDLAALIVGRLGNERFRQQCATVRGETALLICAQKGAYLWWLSIGDIPVYVFHPDFARFNQFALNQRMFFEWVGKVNTFALPVPCYATGVRQLRAGRNTILLTTDGLLECGTRPFENPCALYDVFHTGQSEQERNAAMQTALEIVRTERGRDSATAISWQVDVSPFADLMQPTA